MSNIKTLKLSRTKTQFPGLPEPTIARDCLYIESPYSKQFVDDIKEIHWRQRKYDPSNPSVWMVVEDDPDQKPDEPTNLVYIQRICKAAAEANGWQFLDYTEKTEAEIQAQLAQAEQEDLEAHVTAVCSILPSMPAQSLKIVSWGHKVIKLQLQRYIDTELWRQLKDACTKVWKPGMLLLGAGQRFDFGFVFEMATDHRIIKALMVHSRIGNLKVQTLQLLSTFDNGVVHLASENAGKWMGMPIEQSDLSEINWGSQPWELAEVNGVLYWVANIEQFVCSWLDESPYYRVYSSAVQKTESTLERVIWQNHIEEWYGEFGRNLLNAVDFRRSPYTPAHRPEAWEHPADPLWKHIRRFSSTELIYMLGMDERIFNWRVDEINNIRESKAAEARAEARKTAIAVVVADLQKESKDTLLMLAGDRAKSSWSKTRIAQSFVTQEYAERRLGIYEENPMPTTASEEMIVIAGIAGMSFAFEPHEINFHPSIEEVNRVECTLKGVSISDLDKLIELKDSGKTFEVKHYLPTAPVLTLECAKLVRVSPGESGSVPNGPVLFKTVEIEYQQGSAN